MKSNKGFTVYELLIGFVFLIVIGYFILTTMFDIRDKQQMSVIKSKLIDFKTSLTNDIEMDLMKYRFISQSSCGTNCIDITFANGLVKRLSIDTDHNKILYGNTEYNLIQDSYFSSPVSFEVEVVNDTIDDRKNSLLKINIPIEHYEINGSYGMSILCQYSNHDVITPINMTVLGSNPATLYLGDTYYDEGATANSPKDGDISSSIIVTSDVDTNALGTYTVTYNVEDSTCATAIRTRTVNVVNSGLSAPVLATGMIPVYYDEGVGEWKKADINNSGYNWYNYNAQKWANAVTVTSTNRTTYQNTTVGTTIPMGDINTMFVWIPRYKYKIPAGTGARQIDVVFESNTMPKSTGDAISTYLTHPAFTFGATELTGIWVSKFETSGSITSSTIFSITIKPDLQSCRSTIKTMFEVSRAIQNNGNAYGFSTTGMDTHMMKTTEWGAAAYLSQSIYGKYGSASYTGVNKEIYMNNSSDNYTGRSMGAPGGKGIQTYIEEGGITREYAPTGYFTYDGKCAVIDSLLPAPCNSGSIGQSLNDKTLSYGASTTGNIYGIYDMSGGGWDILMGVYKPNPIIAGISDYSGFSSSTTNSQYDLLTINSKYYDQYLTTNVSTAAIKGDATQEVNAWYSDFNAFLTTTSPWMERGGCYSEFASAGPFAYLFNMGGLTSDAGFRIVISLNP